MEKKKTHTAGEVWDHLVARAKKCKKFDKKIQEIAKLHKEGNDEKAKKLANDVMVDEFFDKSVELASGFEPTGLLTVVKICYHISKGDSKKATEDAVNGMASIVIIGAVLACRIF